MMIVHPDFLRGRHFLDVKEVYKEHNSAVPSKMLIRWYYMYSIVVLYNSSDVFTTTVHSRGLLNDK